MLKLDWLKLITETSKRCHNHFAMKQKGWQYFPANLLWKTFFHLLCTMHSTKSCSFEKAKDYYLYIWWTDAFDASKFALYTCSFLKEVETLISDMQTMRRFYNNLRVFLMYFENVLPYHFRNGILLAHEGKFCFFLAGIRLEKYLNFHHYLLVTI